MQIQYQNSEKPNESLKKEETEKKKGALSGFKNKKKIQAIIAPDLSDESDSDDEEKSSKPHYQKE